jgi:hypothetical protein
VLNAYQPSSAHTTTKQDPLAAATPVQTFLCRPNPQAVLCELTHHRCYWFRDAVQQQHPSSHCFSGGRFLLTGDFLKNNTIFKIIFINNTLF